MFLYREVIFPSWKKKNRSAINLTVYEICFLIYSYMYNIWPQVYKHLTTPPPLLHAMALRIWNKPLSFSEGKLQRYTIQRHPIHLRASKFLATENISYPHMSIIDRCQQTFGHVMYGRFSCTRAGL